MPRYAVKVSQIETRTKTLYVNASSAIEAVDIAHDSITRTFIKGFDDVAPSINYSFTDAHSVRDIQPSRSASEIKASADEIADALKSKGIM